MSTSFNSDDALRFYRWLGHRKDEWTELRAIPWPPGKGVSQTWVNTAEGFAEFCKQWNGKKNIYVGINPRKTDGGGKTGDVSRVVAIPFDIDSPHAKDIPASDVELDEAEVDAYTLSDMIVDRGFKRPYIQMTGNGYHVIQKVDIPVFDGIAQKLELYFDEVKRYEVDKKKPFADLDSIFDLPRIIKVPGTMSVKGVPDETHPLRRATIVYESFNMPDKTLGGYLFSLEVPETETPSQPVKVGGLSAVKINRLRPCFKKFVKEGGRMSTTSKNDHILRLALVQEANAEGFTYGEIVQCFTKSVDYKPEPTQYQVTQELDKIRQVGPRTWRCLKIHHKTGCLGELCPLYRKNVHNHLHRGEEAFERSPEDFFTKNQKGEIKRFVPKLLGDAILEEYRFAASGEKSELFFYREERGIWDTAGIEKIQSLTAFWLEKLFNSKYSSEVVKYIRYTNYVDRRVFGGIPHKVVMQNGVFDLKSKKLEPFDPDVYALSALPVKYDSEATCPAIDQFIIDVLLPEDIPKIYELTGFCLIREYFLERIFVMYGGGANGKSRLLYMVNMFLGGSDNVSSLTLQQLSTDRFSAAQLYGKMANIAPDIPANTIKFTGMIKTLSGGTDQVTVQRKFFEHFQFINTAKLIFSCNEIPKSADMSDGFYRRMIILRFPNQFLPDNPKTDPQIHLKITTPEELSGMFNKAVTALDTLTAQGQFTNEKPQDQRRDEWVMASDPAQYFSMKYIKMGGPETDYIPKGELYSLYARWCHTQEKRPIPSNKFTVSLRQSLPYIDEGTRKIDEKKVRVWYGVYVDMDTLKLAPRPGAKPKKTGLDHYNEPEEEPLDDGYDEEESPEPVTQPTPPKGKSLDIPGVFATMFDEIDRSPDGVKTEELVKVAWLAGATQSDGQLKKILEYAGKDKCWFHPTRMVWLKK